MNNIAEQHHVSKQKWSDLTAEYAKVLFPLINREGYGCKYKGKHIHCNSKEELYLFHTDKKGYFKQFGKWYLPVFTKKHLEQVTTGAASFYFTGSTGPIALVMVDFDAHNGEPDCPELVNHIQGLLPQCYSEPSDRGHHLYLKLDTNGFSAANVNKFYKYMGDVLQRQRTGNGFKADVEIKGTIQHRKNLEWHCGVIARIPQIRTPVELAAFKAVPPASILDLFNSLREIDRNKENLKEQNREQTILVRKTETQICHKSNISGDLQTEKLHTKPVPGPAPEKGSATARRMAAFWEFVKTEQRLPTPQQLLTYIQEHDHYTKPWTYHEKERAADVQRIIENNRHKYRPERAVTNYNPLAKELAAIAPKGITWEDLTIYLSAIEQAVIKDPNDDGTVPCARIQELWTHIARFKQLKRKWDDKRAAAIRRHLEKIGFLTMLDDRYGHRKAMKFTIGPKHPQFSNRFKIIPTMRFPDAGIDPNFDPRKFMKSAA